MDKDYILKQTIDGSYAVYYILGDNGPYDSYVTRQLMFDQRKGGWCWQPNTLFHTILRHEKYVTKFNELTEHIQCKVLEAFLNE